MCPECGRKFTRNRQDHSCVRYDPELLFIGKSQKTRDLYKLIIEKVQVFGEIEITGINPRASPVPIFRCRAAGYYTLRLRRDCSTYNFSFTSFEKIESHE